MTIDISNNAARVNYTVAQGATQTSFSVPFEFFNDADLSVYVDDVLKTITTDYTVSGGDGSTGTVTISVTGASGGSTVVISRSIAIERTSDFVTGVDINRAALNTQLDKLTAIAADNQDKANRSITAPNSETNPSLELPSVDNRKGKLIGFHETTGALITTATLSDVAGLSAISADIATLADIEDGTEATDAIQTVAGISSNVTTVAGNSTNINTVAGISADVTAVAAVASDVANAESNATAAAASAAAASTSETNAGTSASAAAASQVSAAASAASAANAYDTFDDKYLGSKTGYSGDGTGPTVDNDGDPLVEGALFFSADANEMRVYDGSNWIAASSSGSASLILYEFTATSGQTTFSGADDNGATLGYTALNIQVVMNGVILDPSDYTASNGTSVVLGTGAATGDLLNVYAFASFTVADTVSASSGGTFAAGITVQGSVTANTVSLGDNNKAIFGAGSDLQIYHSGSHSYIAENGTGNLTLSAGNFYLNNAADTENMLSAVNAGAVTLFYNNAAKLATTSTGIDVTGTVVTDGVTVDGTLDIQEVYEKVTTITSTTGTITLDTTQQAIIYGTADQTANRTINFSNVNANLAIGQSVSCSLLMLQGSTAYYLNAYQVDGSAVTPKWSGGSAPSGGNASSIDVYTFTIIKTADATFTVLASQTQFA